MERKIILDFIAQNFNQLRMIDFKKMTIYQFGKKYQENSPILNGEILFAYEVNLPRINIKTFSLDKMNEGILEFARTIDQLMVFSHDDINFDICEVYSGKNLRDIDFKYLYLQPIYIENQLVGVISMYADVNTNPFCFNKTSLTVLYNQLEQVDINHLNQELLFALTDINDYYYILKNGDENKVYLSDSLKFKLNLTKSVLDFTDDLVKKFLSHHLIKEKKLKFPYENYKLFYILKALYDDQISNYLHINAINKLDLPDEFTMVVVLWNDEKTFSVVTNDVNFGAKYYLCAYDQDYYLLIIGRKYAANLISHLFKKYDCQYLVLHAPTDINNQMDFNKVMDYIKTTRCEKFIYSDYVSYYNALNQEGLNLVLKNRNRLIINSKDESDQLILLNGLSSDFKSQFNLTEFENQTFQKANQFIKKYNQNFAICIDSLSLLKRKCVELLKKCQTKNLQLSLIIDYNQLASKDDLLEAITLLKSFDVKIYVTSSIFLNLKLIDTMRYFDGCYVTKEEFASIQSSPNEFMNMFVSYFFNGNKKIIFEETTNIAYNKRYEDELIFFVKESEKINNEWIK